MLITFFNCNHFWKGSAGESGSRCRHSERRGRRWKRDVPCARTAERRVLVPSPSNGRAPRSWNTLAAPLGRAAHQGPDAPQTLLPTAVQGPLQAGLQPRHVSSKGTCARGGLDPHWASGPTGDLTNSSSSHRHPWHSLPGLLLQMPACPGCLPAALHCPPTWPEPPSRHLGRKGTPRVWLPRPFCISCARTALAVAVEVDGPCRGRRLQPLPSPPPSSSGRSCPFPDTQTRVAGSPPTRGADPGQEGLAHRREQAEALNESRVVRLCQQREGSGFATPGQGLRGTGSGRDLAKMQLGFLQAVCGGSVANLCWKRISSPAASGGDLRESSTAATPGAGLLPRDGGLVPDPA